MALSLPSLVSFLDLFITTNYKPADQQWVRDQGIFGTPEYFHRYLADRQKQRVDDGLPEENPIPVPIDVWANFFPRWKERATNPKLSTVQVPNDPEPEPEEPVEP